MSEPINDAKLVIPFIPSLSHFCVVRIALSLYKHIDAETCSMLLEEMKQSDPAKFDEANSENPKINKAKKKLLFIPAKLRENVLRAILGFHSAVEEWLSDHLLRGCVYFVHEILHWKTDGTIDRIKTMQHFLEREFDIRKDMNIEHRFQLAFHYFLDDHIKKLWPVLKAVQKARSPYGTRFNLFQSFWAEKMENLSEGPLLEDNTERFNLYENHPTPAFSLFFPLLKPEERDKFILSLMEFSSCSDLLCCLYSATKEEEQEILETEVVRVLRAYLNWPLQNFFLQMVEKMWNFINYSFFEELLNCILICIAANQVFDYEKLLADLWEISPEEFKNKAQESEILSCQINSCLDSVNMRKKVDVVESDNTNLD